MVRNYQEAREYLESFIHPSQYEKIINGSNYDPLDRVNHFLSLLGNPHKTFPSVVVSGTSGKGSTTYLIAHLLTQAGYHIGLATSPHLQKMNERICIGKNGILNQISDSDFCKLINEMIPIISELGKSPFGLPTYYEVLMAATFLFFSQRKIDLGVVEVGLEGKYDATNVLSPLIFVLTNISLDHTAILGGTIEEIADEATHRILRLGEDKRNARPVIITGASQKSVLSLIHERANQVNAEVFDIQKDYHVTDIKETHTYTEFDYSDQESEYKDLRVALLGDYQADNAALAVKTILEIQKFGFTITKETMRNALLHAFFAGRFELRTSTRSGIHVDILLDGAHNVAKMGAFLRSLKRLYPEKKKVFLISFKKDKDIDQLSEMIAKEANSIIVTQFSSSLDMGKNLGMPLDDLHRKMSTKIQGTRAIFVEDPNEAFTAAIDQAVGQNALLVVTGSLYLVGEVRGILEDDLSPKSPANGSSMG